MLNIIEHIPLVKRQIDFHKRRLSKDQAKNPDGQSVHQKHVDEFEALLLAMEKDIATSEIPQAQNAAHEFDMSVALEELLQNPTQLSRSQLNGLPQDLLDQLQISEAERFQWAVMDIIEKTPTKIISMEVLLIALYRATGKVYDRTDLANRLYRSLMKKGLLFSVSGRKGLYSTIPQGGEQLVLEPNGDGDQEDTEII